MMFQVSSFLDSVRSWHVQLDRNQPVMMSQVDFLDLYTRRYVSFDRTTPVSMSQVEILRPGHVTPCVVTTRVDTQVKFFRPEHVEDVMVTSMNDVIRNDVFTTFTHYRSNIHQHIMTNTFFALSNVHQTHAATSMFSHKWFFTTIKKKHTHTLQIPQHIQHHSYNTSQVQ